MAVSKIGLAVASFAAAGVVVAGAAALASADDQTSATTSSSASSDGAAQANGGQAGSGQAGAGPDAANQGQAPAGGRGMGGGMGGHQHTAVTGAEKDKVVAAVTAKDSGVSVESVEKDPDGSYDVRGTKGGSPVFYEVSADLATISERAGGPGGGMHGPHGGMGAGGTQGGSGQQGTTLPGSGTTSPATTDSDTTAT